MTDLYGRAADQLGSDKATVRLVALYALERLANDNAAHRQTIVHLLCAYLRKPYTPFDPNFQPIRVVPPEALEERQVRLTAQRLLVTHLHPGNHAYWASPEPITVDLTGATLLDSTCTSARCAVLSPSTASTRAS